MSGTLGKGHSRQRFSFWHTAPLSPTLPPFRGWEKRDEVADKGLGKVDPGQLGNCHIPVIARCEEPLRILFIL
jgi:hypothetical protein